MLLVTAYAVLVALGLHPFDSFKGVSQGATFVAVVLTALTTWVTTKFLPLARRGGDLIGEFIEYARDERHASTVAAGLQLIMDALLDEDPERKIHVFGYSFGALIALDFMFPRTKMYEREVDERLPHAIQSLSTVGCPADFVRLYEPDYLANREPLKDALRWTNIFIAADVFGSNFVDSDDTSEPKVVELPTAAALRTSAHTSYRYTDQVLGSWLDILLRRGFTSHVEYWGEPAESGCIHLVLKTVLDQSVPPASVRPPSACGS